MSYWLVPNPLLLLFESNRAPFDFFVAQSESPRRGEVNRCLAMAYVHYLAFLSLSLLNLCNLLNLLNWLNWFNWLNLLNGIHCYVLLNLVRLLHLLHLRNLLNMCNLLVLRCLLYWLNWLSLLSMRSYLRAARPIHWGSIHLIPPEKKQTRAHLQCWPGLARGPRWAAFTYLSHVTYAPYT